MLTAILAAAKAKAPIVAIPAEGRAPLCLNAKLLKSALKGVTLTSAEIVDHDGGKRSLKLKARTNAGYFSCTIVAIDRRTAQKELGKWAERERIKLQKKVAMGALSVPQRKAAKLAELQAAHEVEANRERVEAQATIVDMKARALPIVMPVESREETAQAFSYKRTFRRQRGMYGSLKRRLLAVRADMYRMVDRPILRVRIAPRRFRNEESPKRFLRGADTLRYIALVQQALEIGERMADIRNTLPWGALYIHGAKVSRSNDWQSRYAPEPLSEAWRNDRLSRARRYCAALEVLRTVPVVRLSDEVEKCEVAKVLVIPLRPYELAQAA